MTPLELKEEVRKRVAEARRKKIWHKARHIAEKFGQVSTRAYMDHTLRDYVLKLGEMEIHKFTQLFGGNYLKIFICNEIVFDAAVVECNRTKISQDFLMPLPKKLGLALKAVHIKAYIPGEWESWLYDKKVDLYLSAKKAEARKLEEDKILEEIDRKLKDSELELAKLFGITT